jgi:hypothetical protein
LYLLLRKHSPASGHEYIFRPTFFAELIFFPAKIFSGTLEKGNPFEQKKFGGKKST